MESLLELKGKPALTPAEARNVLQLIQQLTSPILSTRGSNFQAQAQQGSQIKPVVLPFSKANESAVKHQRSLNIGSSEDFPALSVQPK